MKENHHPFNQNTFPLFRFSCTLDGSTVPAAVVVPLDRSFEWWFRYQVAASDDEFCFHNPVSRQTLLARPGGHRTRVVTVAAQDVTAWLLVQSVRAGEGNGDASSQADEVIAFEFADEGFFFMPQTKASTWTDPPNGATVVPGAHRDWWFEYAAGDGGAGEAFFYNPVRREKVVGTPPYGAALVRPGATSTIRATQVTGPASPARSGATAGGAESPHSPTSHLNTLDVSYEGAGAMLSPATAQVLAASQSAHGLSPALASRIEADMQGSLRASSDAQRSLNLSIQDSLSSSQRRQRELLSSMSPQSSGSRGSDGASLRAANPPQARTAPDYPKTGRQVDPTNVAACYTWTPAGGDGPFYFAPVSGSTLAPPETAKVVRLASGVTHWFLGFGDDGAPEWRDPVSAAVVAAAPPATPGNVVHSEHAYFYRFDDAASGLTYFYNPLTRETVWDTLPAGRATTLASWAKVWFVMDLAGAASTHYFNPATTATTWAEPPGADGAVLIPGVVGGDTWFEYYDAALRVPFFHNPVLRQTRFNCPVGARVIAAPVVSDAAEASSPPEGALIPSGQCYVYGEATNKFFYAPAARASFWASPARGCAFVDDPHPNRVFAHSTNGGDGASADLFYNPLTRVVSRGAAPTDALVVDAGGTVAEAAGFEVSWENDFDRRKSLAAQEQDRLAASLRANDAQGASPQRSGASGATPPPGLGSRLVAAVAMQRPGVGRGGVAVGADGDETARLRQLEAELDASFKQQHGASHIDESSFGPPLLCLCGGFIFIFYCGKGGR